MAHMFVLKRLIKIREDKGLNFVIGVDGGINENNINKLSDVGVEVGYCGNAVFSGNVRDNLEKLNYVGKN
jgi:ribulose-phosphate 3-epimerase